MIGISARYAQRSTVNPTRHKRSRLTLCITRRCSYGSPLSPLLSNIVLDELDQELARRGHRFARYADDAKVYVRSERAGRRVMASLTEFIEGRLRLKVNQAKSAVARPEDRHFLGFCLRVDPQSQTVEVLLSERTKRNAMDRVRQLTPRTWGGTLVSCIARINAWLRGWHGFFGIASASETQAMRKLDAHIRRRLRAILLRHWRRRRTIARRLIELGVPRRSAWRQVYQGHRSWWALSHIPAVDHALNRAFFRERGLVAVVEIHRQAPQHIIAPESPQLALWDDFEVANRPAAGGHNPPSRRAVYDQRTYGSVGAGAGNRPGYPRARTCAGAPSGRGQPARLATSATSRVGSVGSVRTKAIDSAER